jgi:hypothetical protein
MSNDELNSRATWRLIGAAMLLALACTTGALLTLRADAQGAQGRATAAPPPPAAGTGRAPQAGADRGTSAPIPDDPVVAPDPHESADNNVSFPADI